MQRAQESLGDQPASDTPCAVLNAELVLLLCLEAWGFPDLPGRTVPRGAGWIRSGTIAWTMPGVSSARTALSMHSTSCDIPIVSSAVPTRDGSTRPGGSARCRMSRRPSGDSSH